MTDQAKKVAFQERMDVDVSSVARGLIQDYIGPDHKVLDMQRFHSALTNALRRAREQGRLIAPEPSTVMSLGSRVCSLLRALLLVPQFECPSTL
jgi:hypothetical protein